MCNWKNWEKGKTLDVGLSCQRKDFITKLSSLFNNIEYYRVQEAIRNFNEKQEASNERRKRTITWLQ